MTTKKILTLIERDERGQRHGVEQRGDALYIKSWCCNAAIEDEGQRCGKCSRAFAKMWADGTSSGSWWVGLYPLTGPNDNLATWLSAWLGEPVEVEVFK